MFAQISFNDTLPVIITGLLIVFAVCVFIFLMFGKYLKADNKGTGKKMSGGMSFDKAQDTAEPEAQNKTSGAAISPSAEDELIAVITAAALTALAADGKTYAVRSVRRSERRPAWAAAGLIENTRPF